jgi:hypothetical protein
MILFTIRSKYRITLILQLLYAKNIVGLDVYQFSKYKRMLHLEIILLLGDERRMSSFQIENQRAVIDIRERVLKGEHPRREIINFVKSAPVGTLFEIHLPHRGEPLVATFQSLGMNAIVNEVEPAHFRLMAIKLNEV